MARPQHQLPLASRPPCARPTRQLNVCRGARSAAHTILCRTVRRRRVRHNPDPAYRLCCSGEPGRPACVVWSAGRHGSPSVRCAKKRALELKADCVTAVRQAPATPGDLHA